MDVFQEALELHKKFKGKLDIKIKFPITSRKDLSLAYTPGVAQPCREIAKDPARVYDYTIKGNTVAVISDGSAVLGLGNIGGLASIPVMEGKAALFKEFADIDSFPICIANQNIDIVEFVKNISPVFGGINLEDISAPRCFEIEEKLQNIGIPVMHDDQHGTAVVVLAALINAAKVTGKNFSELKVTISGAGAAGTAIAKMLLCVNIDPKICTPVRNIIMCDRKGIIHRGRADITEHKKELAVLTNKKNIQGTLSDALEGSDVFIGVSAPDIVSGEMIKRMAPEPIVFAMANPIPEIMPDKAKEAGATVVATGRSDFPNQVNNVLGFPGIFRGALDAKATKINKEMLIAAANALANCVHKPIPEQILPDPLDKTIVPKIAEAVKQAAIDTKVVRIE
ncbi:NAD-dependent malic enzyme [Candidatus Woesearchaeota archaeon]|nr:MAG: NAD-dependent malic enzyme [Candidatus Woesearchaeota archaeon]